MIISFLLGFILASTLAYFVIIGMLEEIKEIMKGTIIQVHGKDRQGKVVII